MTINNKGRLSSLLIIISGLLLAVIVTTTVVALKNPMHQTNDIFSEPSNSTSNQTNEQILSSSEAPMASISATGTASSASKATSTFESAMAQETSSQQENNSSQQENNSNQLCSNPRVRRSWTELNNDEKIRFLNAVNQMKSKPSQTGSAANRYEDFTVIHDTYKSVAHNISTFLPWHRHFINDFERELQTIDSSLTLPYWDWASDAANPAASTVLASDAFGGDGDPQTGCVTNGAFANWHVSYPSPHCLQRRFNGGHSVIQRWSSPSQVAALVFRFTDYSQFRSAFESTPHAAVHNGIGGDMRQTYAPNDPLFWLHHANVDRYFQAWQIENPRSSYNRGSLNDILQPFNIRVSTAFTLPTNSRYCYTYSMGSNSMRGALRKRNTKELECPAHIPDEYTISMGCSVEHVRMTEKYICDFTRRLNQKLSFSAGMKIETSLPEDNSTTKDKIWRFHSGRERELILDSLG